MENIFTHANRIFLLIHTNGYNKPFHADPEGRAGELKRYKSVMNGGD